MNILYIGNYRDSLSGWADASACWVKALNRVGHDLAIRYYSYSDNKSQLSDLFSKLEAKTLKGVDIVIQNILPANMEPVEGCYNIGICYFESEGVLLNSANGWAEKLLKMDEIWVTTPLEQRELQSVGYTNSRIIPQSIDTYELTSVIGTILEDDGLYKFYSIGADSSPRKNLDGLVAGYLSSFSSIDKVQLVLKVKDASRVNELFASFERQTGRSDLPRIATITNNLSREDMIRLHNSCDCYVSASFQESIGRPPMEAAALGSRVVALENTTTAELLSLQDVIESEKTYCRPEYKNPVGIYSESEQWYVSTPQQIGSALRSIYKDRNKTINIPVSKYDIKNVSSQIYSRLNEIEKLCSVST